MLDEQPIPKPNCGQPDITQDVIGVQTCLSEENKNVGVEQTHDRSGQPDKCSDAVHHEIKMLHTDNEFLRERIEEDIGFNVPGVPHSTVKQLHGASVRELVQKIENHRIDMLFKSDLQQSQSFKREFAQEEMQEETYLGYSRPVHP